MHHLLLTIAAVCAISFSTVAEEIRPRLVSLAPSITELVYAVGAERFLAGTADGSIHPAQALALPRVGDFSNPDPDAVNALMPDIVLVLEEHMPPRAFFNIVFAPHVIMKHNTLEGILDSLTMLGELCGMPYEAGKLRDELQASFSLPLGYDEKSAPSMLLLIGGTDGEFPIAKAVGNDGLYSRLIPAVGCKNAYTGNEPYPGLSLQMIANLNPDIIVQGIYSRPGAIPDDVPVLDKSVFSIRADYAFVPGLRMVLMKRDLEEFVRVSGKSGFSLVTHGRTGIIAREPR